MKEQVAKNFQRRIVNATRSELVVIHYEMMIEQLQEAIQILEKEPVKEKGSLFEPTVDLALKMLKELIGSLDYHYALSKELLSFYLYINRRILDGRRKREVDPLLEAKMRLERVKRSWEEVANQVKGSEQPIITNGQKVYAGLTYGKSDLVEIVENPRNRGYKA